MEIRKINLYVWLVGGSVCARAYTHKCSIFSTLDVSSHWLTVYPNKIEDTKVDLGVSNVICVKEE